MLINIIIITNNLNSNNNIINIKSNFYKYSTIKPSDSEINFYPENNNNNIPIKTIILLNENINGKEMLIKK